MARLSEVAMRIHVGLLESSFRRGVCVIWAMVWLAQARGSCLSEITWCSHCFKLAQARRTSLSEAEGLAWARVLGLSEFMRIVHVCVCLCVWFGYFTLSIGSICMWCVFGLEGLSPIGVYDVIDGCTHAYT